MKRILKVLSILAIVGLLFLAGVTVDDSGSEKLSYKGLAFSSVKEVSADDPPPCPALEPGEPDDCRGG